MQLDVVLFARTLGDMNGVGKELGAGRCVSTRDRSATHVVQGKLFQHFFCKVWEFPKIRGTSLGVPIIRTIVYWGLYWGTLILGNYRVVTE